MKALRPPSGVAASGTNQQGGSEMVAIFVILTIVAFILVDAAVQRRQVRR
ncbi:MAG TPA: hypothetical protein VFS12_04010 [Terriglobia bacterium]|nr:hypothetical protein [Terriglobia bacterium]